MEIRKDRPINHCRSSSKVLLFAWNACQSASLTDETIKSTSLWKSSRYSAGIYLRNVLFKTEKQKTKLKMKKKTVHSIAQVVHIIIHQWQGKSTDLPLIRTFCAYLVFSKHCLPEANGLPFFHREVIRNHITDSIHNHSFFSVIVQCNQIYSGT